MIDISNRIHQSMVEVFAAIQRAAQAEEIAFFVVGATARDILLGHAYGLPVRRATQDIDIAVRVSDWNHYDRLTTMLVSTGDFRRVGVGQRFIFRNTEPIDIVPFGEIAGKTQSIAWPPTEGFVMGVLGFEEAFHSALLVTLRQDPRLDVRVSTLAGLAIMKLISWNESYPRRGRDGDDFYFIAKSYVDAGNDGRIHDKASDLAKVGSIDRQIAGARLLGRDMEELADEETYRVLEKILEHETDRNGPLRLLTDIIGTNITRQEEEDYILELITGVREGLLEGHR